MSCRRDIFSAGFTPHFHAQQISLETVHTRTQTVTPSDEELTCEIRRGFESSDQAELAYPP